MPSQQPPKSDRRDRQIDLSRLPLMAESDHDLLQVGPEPSDYLRRDLDNGDRMGL